MKWKDILKISRLELEIAREYAPEELAKRGRKVTRPDSKRLKGRPMSRFNEEDANRAKRERDKIMSRGKALREAEEARQKALEEYRNSPEAKKTQKYGKVMCRDCGSEYYADDNFKGKCDGGDSYTNNYGGKDGGCGAEGDDMFTVVEQGEMGNTERYMR